MPGSDAGVWLPRIETKRVNGCTTFNRHAYVLNAAHQRTSQTRPDASYVDYTYDDAGQLSTALSYTSGGSPITTEQLKYGYDAAQNLTKRTNDTTDTTYSVNSLNQITSDGGASWTHDHNGNRTYQPNGVGSYNYTYDDENQLVAAQTDTSSTPTGSRWKTVWTYDARGRVRVREDYGWYAPGSYFLLSTTTRYLYDGMRVIQERNASNVPQVTYTRGLDLVGSWERAGGIGGLLARTAHSGANGVTYTPAFYHADGNGNVTYLLKLDQTMGATYTFDPYGRQLASSGTLANANTYRFSSKELMVASGLYYYGYRFYDPNTQRWLNRDPIEEAGGINLYGFVGNKPVSWVDCFGLKEYSCEETQAILEGLRKDATGPWGPLKALLNHIGHGDHDYKGMNVWHRFNVNGQLMEADEFGNYAAGYSGIDSMGILGYIGVRIGGVLYDFEDSRRERDVNDRARAKDRGRSGIGRGSEVQENVFDWDKDSVPAIDAGAERAVKELFSSLETNECP